MHIEHFSVRFYSLLSIGGVLVLLSGTDMCLLVSAAREAYLSVLCCWLNPNTCFGWQHSTAS